MHRFIHQDMQNKEKLEKRANYYLLNPVSKLQLMHMMQKYEYLLNIGIQHQYLMILLTKKVLH